jgi:CubicO group peptidase (beta-lactamase class C family)
MSAEPLFDIEQEINARFRSINAFLIVRKGYLVYESYYNGFGRDNKQLLASVTKSFISALIGIAIDQGFIEGVDQHVLDFFPEFEPDPRDYLKQQMTIKHLLTMTAGFQWRTGPRANEQLIDRLRRSKDWVAFILNLPVRERLMGTFQYNSACSHLLSAIITRSTGRCAEEFAAENSPQITCLNLSALTNPTPTCSILTARQTCSEILPGVGPRIHRETALGDGGCF